FWLLVEDDDNDALLFSRACRRAFPQPPAIHRETNGASAKEFLQNTQLKPRLIISDIKMPRVTGLELLDWLRQKPEFQDVRFVLLSHSDAEKDLTRARALGADAYLFKPADDKSVSRLVSSVGRSTVADSSSEPLGQ